MDIEFNVTVELNAQRTTEKIVKKINSVQGILDAQVLKDSNYYCPMYTGTLMKSGIMATVCGSGNVQWNAPYAHKQYYGFPNKYLLKNPNASQKWFEVAKAQKLQNWIKLVNDQYSKHS